MHALSVVSCLLIASGAWAQLLAPQLPERYESRQYEALFRGVNMCAYKEVKQTDGAPVMAWTCGLTTGGKSG